MSLSDKIAEVTAANPDWDSGQIGRAVGCRSEYVRAVIQRRKLRPPRPMFGAKLTFDQRAEIACSIEKPRFICARYGISPSHVHRLRTDGWPGIPDSVLAERDRRLAALQKRDLTATLMGDPPPCR